MTGLSWELAGGIILFQALQAIVVGGMIALLLWYEKRTRARLERTRGDRA
jgi:4-amino-4-deoxy-L-arabinose transferase-like glycosyltransferase